MEDDEKLFKAYDWVFQRIHQMDHVLSERTNIFLLSSSILVAGFMILYSQVGLRGIPVYIVMATVGIILAIHQSICSIRDVRELNYWFLCCQAMENDNEAFKILKNNDLVITGFKKWWAREPNQYTKQKDKPTYKAKPMGKFERFILSRSLIFHPHSLYRYTVPISFIAIWITALNWVL